MRPVTGLLGVIALGLVGAIVFQLTATRAPHFDGKALGAETGANAMNLPVQNWSMDPPSAPALVATLERPIFHPSRRPLKPRPPEPAAAAQPAPATDAASTPQLTELYLLRGAIVTTARGIALVERVASQETIRIAEGQMLEGWTLSDVSATSAIFERDGQKVALELAKTQGSNRPTGATP